MFWWDVFILYKESFLCYFIRSPKPCARHPSSFENYLFQVALYFPFWMIFRCSRASPVSYSMMAQVVLAEILSRDSVIVLSVSLPPTALYTLCSYFFLFGGYFVVFYSCAWCVRVGYLCLFLFEGVALTSTLGGDIMVLWVFRFLILVG